MLQPYPIADVSAVDNAANADIEWLKQVIIGVRTIRGEMNIPPGKALDIVLSNGDDNDKDRMTIHAQALRKLAKLESITWLENTESAPVSATALVGNLEILVPMAGLIDKDAELTRLGKEIEKLGKDLSRIEGKLSNASFVDKAPAEVVAKEREKLAEQQAAMEKLQEQEKRIQAI